MSGVMMDLMELISTTTKLIAIIGHMPLSVFWMLVPLYSG